MGKGFDDFLAKMGFSVGSSYEDEPSAEDDTDDSESFFEEKPKKFGKGKKDSDKVLNINTTTQLEVVLVKPECFDDATAIADQLINKRTVVLNLESTSKEVSRRLIDFLIGVAYAQKGQLKRVANSTFIITPYNVGVIGELVDELSNSGVFFC